MSDIKVNIHGNIQRAEAHLSACKREYDDFFNQNPIVALLQPLKRLELAANLKAAQKRLLNAHRPKN